MSTRIDETAAPKIGSKERRKQLLMDHGLM
jgi:hypothetical protein